MKVLVFDTSTECLLTGLWDAGVWTVENSQDTMNHSAHLAPAVCRLMEKSPGPPDLIICQKGPGSFTGLRIGFAAAKGYSEGWQIPLVAVSPLDAMAWMNKGQTETLVPVIDARKGRFYTAFYDSDAQRTSDYLDLSPSVLAERLAGREALFCGYQGAHLAARLREEKLWDPLWRETEGDTNWLPGLLALGLEAWQKGHTVSSAEGPFYLRESDAIPPASRGVSDPLK